MRLLHVLTLVILDKIHTADAHLSHRTSARMFFAIQLRLLLIFEGLGLWRGGRLFEFDIYDGFTRTEC